VVAISLSELNVVKSDFYIGIFVISLLVPTLVRANLYRDFCNISISSKCGSKGLFIGFFLLSLSILNVGRSNFI
jgi:hypothetical protein